MRKTLFATATVMALATAMPAAAANLLVNGGFDLDTVTPGALKLYPTGAALGGGGWTVLGAAGDNGAIASLSTTYTEPGNIFTSQAGPVSLDLTGSFNRPQSGITQTVATLVGQLYELSFYLGNINGTNFPLASSLNLSINGGPATLFTNGAITAGTTNWRQFNVQFTGVGTSTTVTFLNATPGGDFYAGLDTVSLDAITAPPGAIPEPSTWAMMIGGFGAMGMAMRRGRRTRASFA